MQTGRNISYFAQMCFPYCVIFTMYYLSITHSYVLYTGRIVQKADFLFLTNASIQTGTNAASLETQRELQSAAHTFYQQVVCVLKQRVQLEKEHPGIQQGHFP